MPSTFRQFGPVTAQGLLAMFERERAYSEPGRAGNLQSTDQFRFKNVSGEEIPAFACMKIRNPTSVDNTNNWLTLYCEKPDETGGPFVFNSQTPVAPNKYGRWITGTVKGLFTSGSPLVGEIWGPTNDWVLESDGDRALQVYGDIGDGVVFGTTITTGGGIVIKCPSGGIPARVGTTLGSAVCTVCKRDGTDLILTTRTETVYNTLLVAVNNTTERIGQAKQDIFGDYYCDVEDCSDVP
jgi:hypothetical protein